MIPYRRTSIQNGGLASGYQELFAALAIPTTTGQAGGKPYIYTLLRLVRTPASAAMRCAGIIEGLQAGDIVAWLYGPFRRAGGCAGLACDEASPAVGGPG
jgi:hypothetical protein